MKFFFSVVLRGVNIYFEQYCKINYLKYTEKKYLSNKYTADEYLILRVKHFRFCT